MQRDPTEIDRAAAAPAESASRSRTVLRREVSDTLTLAVPMAASQLGQVAMMTTDLALIGRLGGTALAAASLAHAFLFSCFVLGLGLVSAVAPIAAQAYGARDPRTMRRSLRVGIWAAVIAGIPMTLLQLRGERILVFLGQDANTAAIAGQYLAGLGWSLIPAWIFIAVRNFMSALNKPEPALWITVAAIPINAVLAYGLIDGALGMPRLGIVGAGVATTIVNIGMCAAAFWVTATHRPFKKFHVLGNLTKPDWPLLSRLTLLGLPISGAFALEYGLFALAGLMMGWIGTAELAAHQIAFQMASIIFMVPFGISMAATVRVGHAIGRQDHVAARRAGLTAIALAAVFECAMTLVIVVTNRKVPGLFLDTSDPANAAALAIAGTLLLVGASFFVADGIQTVAAGALRGLGDARIPLGMAAAGFWAIGFPAAWYLGFRTSLGATGIWIGLTIGIVAYAIMLTIRFERLTRPGNSTN